MKALRYHGPRQTLSLEDVPAREPGEGEVLVRVTAAGVCHTELHFQSGLLDLGVAPLTLGHEVVGRIERTGPGVAPERIGERVILYYYLGCGRCAWCRSGDEQLCPALRAEYGFVSDGGFAEYVTVPSRNCVVLPANVSDLEAAPIGCALTTAVHASRLTRLGPGEWAVVYGAGGVGLEIVQVARSWGARVLAVSRSPGKLALARELGAEAVVDASRESPAEAIRAATGGGGADVIFECVGTAETMSAASAALGRRGRLVFIGYSEDRFSVHPIQLVVNEQSVLGSVGATLQDLYDAVDLVSRGTVRTVLGATLPLSSYQTALDALSRGDLIGRAVLEIWDRV